MKDSFEVFCNSLRIAAVAVRATKLSTQPIRPAMEKKISRVLITLSVALLLSACASMSDRTKVTNEETTIVYFASKAKPPPTPAPSPEPAPVPTAKVVIVQGIVYFDFDKHNIRPEFNEVIEQHARVLLENPSIVAKVEGHTDVLGSNDYNTPLGLLRANEVRNALIKLGVQKRQLYPVSYSFRQPVAEGTGASARSKNRRAEIIYQL